MKPLFDLHLHSSASDGSQPPAELAGECARRGISVMALSDHDTVDGVEEARSAGERLGIRVIPAIELSAAFAGEMHILGYGIDFRSGEILSFLRSQREERALRLPRILARLNGLGVPIRREDVDREIGGEVAGRFHIARALVRIGACSSEQEAFDRFLSREAPAYVARGLPGPREAVALIRAAGGSAVLAHPATLGLQGPALESLAAELARAGLAGLEAFYPASSDAYAREMLRLCRRTGLIPTYGSDSHGSGRDVPPGGGWERFAPLIPPETYAFIDTLYDP